MSILSSLRRHIRFVTLLPLLSGCGAEAVTHDQAADAIRKCGMLPDEVLWRVGEKGEVVFGRKRADASNPSFEQVDCFMRWATKNEVRVAIVGWEANGS